MHLTEAKADAAKARAHKAELAIHLKDAQVCILGVLGVHPDNL